MKMERQGMKVMSEARHYKVRQKPWILEDEWMCAVT